ncbi:MAG: hypothetical protein E8D41_14405 [Nitrospira sp.]|nr:MAG: hypothetical protein E8D41_14405 [Nitrospira sp.]
MGYLQKYLQGVGLVSTLLFVGVLAGLTAPLPSEAGTPTLKLKVDSGTDTSILITTSSTCTTTERSAGFTACYAINTNLTVAGLGAVGGVQRSYNVRNAPGATARLRVGDNAGGDKFSLIGVQFIPAVTNWGSAAANTNETHKLTITTSQTFDSAVNVANAGNYVWAMRAGGEFRAGPTTSNACAGNGTATGACNNLQNSVTFPGKGTFSPALQSVNILRPSGANSQPLSLTVAGPTAAIVSFNGLSNTTLGQVNPTYPTFLCDQDGTVSGNICKPAYNATMTVTLKGPDSFVLVNGDDAVGAHCTIAEVSATQERRIAFLTNLLGFLQWLEGRYPNRPHLSAFIDRLEAFLATVNSPATDPPDCAAGVRSVNIEFATAAALDQIAFMASGAVPVEPAPQAPETGTITITKNTSGPGGGETSDTFTFNISGPSPSTQTIPMGGANSGSTVVTVNVGTYSITELPIAGWQETSASCGEGGGVSTDEVVVVAGGNVTCTFNNTSYFIRISKQLSFCDGACPSLIFNFHIVGPTTTDATVETNGEGVGDVIVPVEAGTYSIEEFNNPANWHFGSSNCSGVGVGGNPATGIFVPPLASSGGAACHFTNNFD